MSKSFPPQSHTNALPLVLQEHFAAINRSDLPGYLATFSTDCTFSSAAATVSGIGAVELLMEPTFVETEPPKMLYRSHRMEESRRPRGDSSVSVDRASHSGNASSADRASHAGNASSADHTSHSGNASSANHASQTENTDQADHVLVQHVYTKVTRRISVMDKDTDEVLGAYDVDLALNFVIEDNLITSCVTEPLE